MSLNCMCCMTTVIIMLINKIVRQCCFCSLICQKHSSKETNAPMEVESMHLPTLTGCSNHLASGDSFGVVGHCIDYC